MKSVDAAPAQSAELQQHSSVTMHGGASNSLLRDALLEQLWREAGCNGFGLGREEFGETLQRAGTKCNYNQPPGTIATATLAESFWRGLHLRELALTHACALGHAEAWRAFLAEYREPLTRAAIGITGSSSLGQDLADSLYSELYGLSERDGERRSPLLSYSGRGSLMGWLRTTLAQRHVDHHRRTRHEAPLEDDFAAAEAAPAPEEAALSMLHRAVTTTLRALEAEERFMLSAWFLDGRTLQQIARLLRVHEATVSRKIKRLTEKLRKDLLRNLQAGGLSRRAAEEALGTDPRDLSINLRKVLQSSQSPTFSIQALPEPEVPKAT